MAGDTYGRLFTVTTFGESHGPALGCVVDGCPPGLALTEADIQQDLERRRPGRSQYVTQRKEPDKVKILSGVFEGQTTGTAIGLIVENQDQRSGDYSKIKDTFRPGHADSRTSRSTASATTAAAGDRPRARRSCASQPARLRASISPNISA